MAATITITKPHPERWILDIIETTVSDGETVTIEPEPTFKFPETGRIMRIFSKLTSGSASALFPILSTGASDFTGPQVVIATDPGDIVDEAPPGGVCYGLVDGKLYFRSNPNIGSNNNVRTRILIHTGWGA